MIREQREQAVNMFQPPRIPITFVRNRNSRQLSTLPPPTRPTCRENVLEGVKKYLSNTTLHGLNYVGDSAISVFER